MDNPGPWTFEQPAVYPLVPESHVRQADERLRLDVVHASVRMHENGDGTGASVLDTARDLLAFVTTGA